MSQNLKVTQASVRLFTPPIAEKIRVKNVRAIVVCGFLLKSLKKKHPENLKKIIVGAVWELTAK